MKMAYKCNPKKLWKSLDETLLAVIIAHLLLKQIAKYLKKVLLSYPKVRMVFLLLFLKKIVDYNAASVLRRFPTLTHILSFKVYKTHYRFKKKKNHHLPFLCCVFSSHFCQVLFLLHFPVLLFLLYIWPKIFVWKVSL